MIVRAPVGSSNAAVTSAKREAFVPIAAFDVVGNLVNRGWQRFVDVEPSGRENRRLVELLGADDADRLENGPKLGFLNEGGLGAELGRTTPQGRAEEKDPAGDHSGHCDEGRLHEVPVGQLEQPYFRLRALRPTMRCRWPG